VVFDYFSIIKIVRVRRVPKVLTVLEFCVYFFWNVLTLVEELKVLLNFVEFFELIVESILFKIGEKIGLCLESVLGSTIY